LQGNKWGSTKGQKDQMAYCCGAKGGSLRGTLKGKIELDKIGEGKNNSRRPF